MAWTDLPAFAATLESFITAIGIAVAGVWTYLLFVRRRQRYPRASVAHWTASFRLDDGRTLLRVSARIANVGEVLVCFRYARTRVQHLFPLPAHIAETLKACQADPLSPGEHELPWTVLGAREWKFVEKQAEIEPGESEVLHSDFVIPAGVERVIVYTYVTNHHKRGRDIGWSDTSIISLKEETNAAATAAGPPARAAMG